MNKPIRAQYYFYALLIALLYSTSALADVGTWWTAQSASVAPEGETTWVQMVAEEVLLVIEPLRTPPSQEWVRMDHLVRVRVEATFLMRNQGTETEAFDVWFPLTAGAIPDDPYVPSQVENFRAWVDDEPADVEEQPGRDLMGRQEQAPWATWPVTFPPGQDVTLRVAYETVPGEWGGWAIVYYVLETGAGWHGPIGAGTVTIRLPYDVTPQNVQLAEIRAAHTGPGRPFQVTVDGTDLVWRFTNLEPRPGPLWEDSPSADHDNLIVPIMEPSRWFAIEAARADAEANPASVAAQLRLAWALEAGAQRIKSFLHNETNTLLIEETDAAYRRALDLEPEHVDAHAAYLYWLAIFDLGEDFYTVLSRALELAPDDVRVMRLEQYREAWEQGDVLGVWDFALPPVAGPDSTAPIAQPAPTATSRVPPPPTPTTAPLPVATATPTPTPEPRALSRWPLYVGFLLVALILIILRVRR
ncbi:MAG TPA: hypothetical protein ENN99_04380 [Chloroflexi bacterium]|nr:hypothetical protein [Chloroflexota bacterium]